MQYRCGSRVEKQETGRSFALGMEQMRGRMQDDVQRYRITGYNFSNK